ncbi:MAG: phosphotransferase [Acidobacteria bacterium]|nr:phosphotransferase [Acidobacteriota bacterium]MCI0664070.1 phosphotransferase [Acidobacteriota bacterium]
MSIQNPNKVMQTGAAMKLTGGLSEKRIVKYTARYFGIPIKDVRLQALTPDASTRTYYRVAAATKPDETFIISLYASPFNPQDNSYLDVTRLFETAGLPVPKVIDVAGTDGIILQEDLGDCSLTKWLNDSSEAGDPARTEVMLHRAIDLIAQIQAATELAYEMKSVASRLAFDEDKLSWEANYFFDHFFGSLNQKQFAHRQEQAIRSDLQSIAAELASRPWTLTHRDYHGMNLMIDGRDQLRIIDHQDARMGPATYDLVPLLVERRLLPADETWIEGHQDYFLQARKKLGLPPIEVNELRYEFNLMTVQRLLKATGTFSYQTAVVGRGEVYEKYIAPGIASVLRAMKQQGMKEYPALREALENY